MAEKKSNIVEVGGHKYYMDGYLSNNLTEIKRIIKKDWDFLFVVDGMEGGGKSTLAIQAALFLDPTFCMDRIVFDAEEFERAVLKAGKYQAIVYDEAITGLYSREAMQYINTALTKLLAQIRQKNLFIFILIPSFYDIDKYVAMWRSRGLFHIYTKNFERGYFAFFDYEKKKDLYIVGKKYYNYKVERPSFRGRYTKYNPFEGEYRAKKLKIIEKRSHQEINPLYQRDRLIVALYYDVGMSQVEIGKLAGVSKTTIQYVVNKPQNIKKRLAKSQRKVNAVT